MVTTSALAASADMATPTAPAANWQAPLPHGGTLASLTQWWQQFDDPLLASLVAAAQQASPDIASAGSRLAQARANGVAAGAALLPSVDASAQVLRTRADLASPIVSTGSAGLSASWEIDLFGAGRAARNAAQARADGAHADWHDARVAVAAETANSYLDLRACEAQAASEQQDAQSRATTARLSALLTSAGFESSSAQSLMEAAAASASAQADARQTQCAQSIKALAALTALDEADLRQRLQARTAVLPTPAQWQVNTVPAALLQQRPDLYSSARALEAAAADVQGSEAQRWPRISLAGSLSRAQTRFEGASLTGNLWTVGPLQVSVPLFDAGRRSANIDAARVAYEAATLTYQHQLRKAVREVEDALLRLDSGTRRQADLQRAATGFERVMQATRSRQMAGLASALDAEDARRNWLQAQRAHLDAQREQAAAWIALYRALGGGWSAETAPNASASAAPLNMNTASTGSAL
ncbi:MAG: RND transporter [Burkholderiales bacterium PBB6]|nr:MAG: RND transporter [Burkholderiales bacterium PBB6]